MRIYSFMLSFLCNFIFINYIYNIIINFSIMIQLLNSIIYINDFHLIIFL